MFSKGKLALWANDCGKRFLRITWDYVWGVIFWVQKPQKPGIKTDQLIKMQRGTCFCSLRIFLSRRIKGKSREGKKIGGQREKDIPLMKNISLPFPQVLPRKYVFIGVKMKWYYTELQFYRPLKWRINVRKSASYLPATSFSNVSSCLLPTNIFCKRWSISYHLEYCQSPGRERECLGGWEGWQSNVGPNISRTMCTHGLISWN